MADNEEKDKPSGTPVGVVTDRVKLLTDLLAALAALAAVFYAFGYFIVNFRLLDLGARDFSLKNPSYFSAGVLFTVLHALFIVFPIALVMAFEKLPGRKKLAPGQRYLVPVVISFILTASILIFINDGPLESVPKYALVLGTLIGIGSTIQAVREEDPERRDFVGVFFYLWTLLLFPVLLSLWSLWIYPQVDPSYGGGKPVTVQFVIANEKQAGLFNQIGIGFVSGNTTDKLQLVDDNGSTFVVLIPPGNQAARIDKELVANILYWTPSQLRDLAEGKALPATRMP